MKMIALSLLLIISCQAFSQPVVKASAKKIKVGEVKEKATLVAGLYYQVTGKDTMYEMRYFNQKNASVTDIQSIFFNNKDYRVKKLYELLSSFFGDPEKQEYGYKLNIKLGKDEIALSLTRIKDTQSIKISTSYGYFYLNEKQLNELFYG